jgi:CubicO group peptidase (beta-lactamase class C family)
MIKQLLENAINENIIPGAVFFRSVRGGITDKLVMGHAALRPEKRSMLEDTLFDCASLTKPTVTATLTILFADRGLIDLNSPVNEYLPGFSRDDITVFHLMTHTS